MEKTLRKIILPILGFISFFLTLFMMNIITGSASLGVFIKNAINGDSFDIMLFVLIFILFFIIFSVGYLYIGKKVNLFKKKDSLASSDFATLKEFNNFTGDDGIVIGKQFRLSEKKSFEHILCLGPTGSGKSASFFIPNLLLLPAHASVVVSDPKGELFEKTARHALDQGKRILVFSPFKQNTMKYNPLSLCKNVSEIRELAQNLLANGNAAVEQMTGTKAGGSEWTNMATPLLAAFLIFVRDLDPPKNSVSYAINLIVENELETLQFLMEDADPAAQKQFNVFLQSAKSETTASSIKTVLASNLQLFIDPLIEEITSINEISPRQLREHPTHLYVVVPEHKSAYMAPLMGPFYSQLINHLIEDGNGCPVHFLLDEFANIGVLPGIDIATAVARSRSISLSLGIQSVNQLKQRYGEAAETILDNLKTKFALPGLSYNSAEYISKLMGFKEIKTTSTSYGKDSVNHSVSQQKRELLTPDEVRRLEDETMIVISDNRNPFIDEQYRYYKDKNLLRLTERKTDLNAYIEYLREELDNE